MRVARLDEQLASIPGPALEVVETPALGSEDALIVCAGFEDRAIEVLKRAAESGARDFRVVCVEYLPQNASNRSQSVRALCKRCNASQTTWTFDRESPAGAAEEVLALVPGAKIHIDVSGMSRLLIVQLVAQATRQGTLASTTLWYTEALEYPPTRDQVEVRLSDATDPLGVAMFLSSGVFGLTVVPELSSVAMQGQPIVLVAFPSWNPMQLAALRSELQASVFVSVHGIPPDPSNAWRPEAVARLNRSDTLAPVKEFRTSTLDYRETLKALLDVYRAHAQREKIVVSPTGSKMQSVAVGLLCGWLGDIQIVYPTPRTFSAPDDYTRGAKTLYRLPLATFGPPAPQFQEARAPSSNGNTSAP